MVVRSIQFNHKRGICEILTLENMVVKKIDIKKKTSILHQDNRKDGLREL